MKIEVTLKKFPDHEPETETCYVLHFNEAKKPVLDLARWTGTHWRNPFANQRVKGVVAFGTVADLKITERGAA